MASHQDPPRQLFPQSTSFSCPPASLTAPYDDARLLQEVFDASHRRAVIIVSVDAVRHNIRLLKKLASDKTKVMAVVKGAAYGSGVMEVVEAVLAEGATELAVATVSEAVYLRRKGVTVPICVLGNLNIEELPDVLQFNLQPTVSWSRCLKALSDSGNLKYQDGTPLQVHVEIDSGMSRYGVQPESLPSLMSSLSEAGVTVRSLYTHFQSSITSPDLNRRQLEIFIEAAKSYQGIPLHAAATTGCVQSLGTELDFIRPGGAITGLSSGASEQDVELFAKCGFMPSFSVVMKPSHYKLLPPGRHVGYDGTYTSQTHEWIANFSTGWSDGLARKLTNTGYVKRLKTGQMCPIVGRVSMDSITVHLPEEPSEEEAFVLITADFHPLTSAVGVARTLGGAVYEVPGNWSTRLPRVAVSDGKVKKVYHSLDYSN